MSDLYKYIDWLEYWDSEISCQIDSLEDYEPKLFNTTIEEVKSFMKYKNTVIFILECIIDKDDCHICFADGEDDEACSLIFIIGNDDLIKEAIYEQN